jgi:hypothetical protein
MAERTKIMEIWACVGDDGSGTGEGILSQFRTIPPSLAEIVGITPGTSTYVVMIAYDLDTAKSMVRQARITGKPFTVKHYVFDQDVTAEFTQ